MQSRLPEQCLSMFCTNIGVDLRGVIEESAVPELEPEELENL